MTRLKDGVAYRQLQANHLEVNHLSGFCSEVQAGLGYKVNKQTTINLGYQRIWGKKPELTANPEIQTVELRNMPAQQALMIGFSFHFG